ncbi:MAG: histidinol-phosphate transaminase [Gammaproteobacteria bacterium RBG_16_51_14]|nr:MAG: histidinol-phosphate transaminase [Gammaproteobacteria bacterium RBG_16_51_14]
MGCDLFSLATPGVAGLQPYYPGKPTDELERELGLRDIIKLASNENPLGPGSRAKNIVSTVANLSRYPDGNGYALKQVLAAYHGVDTDQLTLGNGSSDVLELVARTFVTSQHQVVFSKYAFAIYTLVTQAIGAEAIVVPALDWGHDLHAMLVAVTEKTRLMFVANPNNPTGTWSDSKSLRTLLESIPEQMIIVVDEAYYDYVTNPDYASCMDWLDTFPNLVVTRTFSKAYGLAGLRIGYAVSHPDVADMMNRVRQPFNVNSIALRAAAAALDDREHIEKSIKVNCDGMQQMEQAFDSMGLHYIPSQGNFICVDLQQPGMEVYNRLLHHGIIVRPVANYDMPNHLRITVGLEDENARLISVFAKVLSE